MFAILQTTKIPYLESKIRDNNKTISFYLAKDSAP